MKVQELKRKNVTIFIIVAIWFIICNVIVAEIDMLSINDASNNNGVTKKGGIAFRTDDNNTLQEYNTLAGIFKDINDTHGRNYHFSCALNFAGSYVEEGDTINFSDPLYISEVKALQVAGHEVMDHTPNHATNFFITSYPASTYLDVGNLPNPGIDHIVELTGSKRKICLEFNSISLVGETSLGVCSINGNEISGNFSNIDYDLDVYVYLDGPGLNKLFFIKEFKANKTIAVIQDVWEEEVSFTYQDNIDFYKFTRSNRLSINGINALARETQKIAEDKEITPPTTWIQPGGRHPVISMAELYTALTPLGYTAGASFGEVQSLKVFNEYDPAGVKKFGMQWEDFNEDHSNRSIEQLKTQISDEIAKHKVMIGHNHFYFLGAPPYVSYQKYIENVEEILNWCNEKNIEVKTYSEWANILYEQTPVPYENIFPPLNVNLDNYTDSNNPDGVPDGYNQKYDLANGKYVTDPEAPSEGNYCFSTSGWFSRVFKIENIGGLEEGDHEFEIWTKGFHENNKIEVNISFPYNDISDLTYEFPASTTIWTKYNLSQSLTTNKSLMIPDSVSEITIEVKTIFNFGNPTLVSGMALYKKKPELSADLTIQLEGAYDGSEMDVDAGFFNNIPKSQPFNVSPWDFTDDVDDLTSIPSDVIDWVLVELRNETAATSIETRKAAFVKKDGKIVALDGTQFKIQVAEGNYYVVIHQRNHLPIMSKTAVSFQLP